MRIVSLLPSATEIVCALGLQDQLVGVTHECDWPPAVTRLPRVTRTAIPHGASSREIDARVRESLKTRRALYTLEMGLLADLKPDLIVTQALCDVCAVADDEVRGAALALPGHPAVVNLAPRSLGDVIDCIRLVGEATDRRMRAEEVIAGLQHRVAGVRRRTATLAQRTRVVVLEWLDPPFSCGHWTPELVELAGGAEVLGVAGQSSRTLRWEDVADRKPDALLVACCGFDLERTRHDLEMLLARPQLSGLSALAEGRVFIVDGNQYFSRPGPRLVDSLEILAHALHPSLHPLPSGLPPALTLSGLLAGDRAVHAA